MYLFLLIRNHFHDVGNIAIQGLTDLSENFGIYIFILAELCKSLSGEARFQAQFGLAHFQINELFPELIITYCHNTPSKINLDNLLYHILEEITRIYFL